jgi:hypothetical protein
LPERNDNYNSILFAESLQVPNNSPEIGNGAINVELKSGATFHLFQIRVCAPLPWFKWLPCYHYTWQADSLTMMSSSFLSMLSGYQMRSVGKMQGYKLVQKPWSSLACMRSS